ncbi:rhamnulose-1-phosphate aldolase/alcohol dehydrogenase [Emticicia oligotrophica DSM 17448]|uniref:Rhamnulose-1-phosphate aldolase/alcohol dehydrogenase n=1 Tax=Emticicia oligotrophica (strain DSM 17448 / CIP 109782 / MTCC 6937 / GPTSA100-15) TaxID=929562 RepID=A0ABM5N2J5_EMTOG|nr:bifunctional rhamnulose-1-phosphate aldolase/short-chain dehydrogenase [Emticicia oligotrophica]AFK03636.1 rhamnulose-1-phosphate aldolase/alcohol dehydrogenase [Emticicia oligotrophica DSM 17448]
MEKALTFKHVSYLWDEAKAAELAQNEVDLFIYRSNLLGADLRLTNYAGGNTSCKITETNPVTGEPAEVMWVKGSGGDIGTLTKKGCANLYVDKLQALKKRYRGLAFEDEMVELFNHCLFDPKCAAPSIDTPLHGLLPFKHIDHLHPDALIAIAASKDGEAIMKEIWGETMAWIPWQRPGFDLGLQLAKTVEENPNIRGVILGGHGLFTWGNTSYESYINTLEVIEMASEFLTANYGKKSPVFGGAKLDSKPVEERKMAAAEIMPTLRGLASSYRQMIGHFTDDPRVLEFVNSNDLERLAQKGTSCPDHFLRTKIRPMVLTGTSKEAIQAQFEAYRADYAAYYERCKHDNSPAIRDSNPVVILYPQVGMFTFAKDKQTARVAAEFYTNAINVMKGAEAVSEYVGLDEQEAFDIEYWLLEEAKLQRMPKPKSLSGKVAFVTGGTGGIGKAICEELMREGACVAAADRNLLEEVQAELRQKYGKDAVITTNIDVTNPEIIAESLRNTVLAFGGVDIVVNCAGLSISKALEDHTLADWNLLQDVLVKGQFLVSQESVRIMREQATGGDIVNIASKNALFAGPNNVGYGTAKAAQAHMTRLMAAELGKDKIRVNTVNPDAVLRGSKIWEGEWAEGRAKAYGIKVEDLPKMYASRTLLNEEILTEDIAKAVRVFVDGSLSKSTGNILNVDGGVAVAFVR